MGKKLVDRLDSVFKPCPKCEAKSGISVFSKDDGSEQGEVYFKVVCCNCGIETKTHRRESDAIYDWNTRATSNSAAGREDKWSKLQYLYKLMFDDKGLSDETGLAILKIMSEAYNLGRATSTTAPVWVREVLEKILKIAEGNTEDWQRVENIRQTCLLCLSDLDSSQSRLPTVEEVVELGTVLTFDAMVEYGKRNGANIVNGMPWSFKINGWSVTHETDTCYIVQKYDGYNKMYPENKVEVQKSGLWVLKNH